MAASTAFLVKALASKGFAEQAFEGACIENVIDNTNVGNEYQLVAGTAWLLPVSSISR